MNTTVTGTALALHNLGVAAGFGGTLFGQMMNSSVDAIDSEKDRGEFLHRTWRNYSPINAAGLAVVGLTWLTGRSMLSGGEIDAETRSLVIAKDILVATYVASGITAIAAGFIGGGREPGMNAMGEPVTSEREAKAIRTSKWSGRVSLIAAAGIVALTAVLNVKAARSVKWSAISRFLP